MVTKSVQTLSDLEGEEVSAVSFVRDYVEIHFDGPVVRSLSNPTVTTPDSRARFPEAGSRDALCQLIGAVVTGVILKEGESFELITDNDCNLVIPLDSQSLRRGEAMHFLPASNRPMEVW